MLEGLNWTSWVMIAPIIFIFFYNSILNIILFLEGKSITAQLDNSLSNILGKFSIAISLVYVVFQALGFNMRLFKLPAVDEISAILFLIGFGLTFASYFTMGKALRLGLPESRTRLVTNGPFSFSRNPIYLGFMFIVVGSILYTLNLSAVFGLMAIFTHASVVPEEEAYLLNEYGDEYEEYCNQVRRAL